MPTPVIGSCNDGSASDQSYSVSFSFDKSSANGVVLDPKHLFLNKVTCDIANAWFYDQYRKVESISAKLMTTLLASQIAKCLPETFPLKSSIGRDRAVDVLIHLQIVFMCAALPLTLF